MNRDIVSDIQRIFKDRREELSHVLGRWVKELDDPNSCIKIPDIRFMNAQIEKLDRLEAKVISQLDDAVRTIIRIQDAVRDRPSGE